MSVKKPSRPFIIANRRRQVAQLRLQQLTTQEITELLPRRGEQNPDTGKPWGMTIIHKDLKALEQGWRLEASQDTANLKAKIVAELREVRRDAWKHRDLNVVLKSIQQECKVLGLDAPTKVDITHSIEEMARELGLDEREAVLAAERIIKAVDSD